MTDEEGAREQKGKEVSVRVISLNGPTALVEWSEGETTHRVYVKSGDVREGRVHERQLERGARYGLPWEEIIVLQAKPGDLANALHASGIWTLADLLTNQRAVLGVLQSVYGLDLARLITAARNYKERR